MIQKDLYYNYKRFIKKYKKKRMIQKVKIQYQPFPYHLVEPSPWPILTSFALLSLTTSAVMYFHGYANGGYLLILGFLLNALWYIFNET